MSLSQGFGSLFFTWCIYIGSLSLSHLYCVLALSLHYLKEHWIVKLNKRWSHPFRSNTEGWQGVQKFWMQRLSYPELSLSRSDGIRIHRCHPSAAANTCSCYAALDWSFNVCVANEDAAKDCWSRKSLHLQSHLLPASKSGQRDPAPNIGPKDQEDILASHLNMFDVPASGDLDIHVRHQKDIKQDAEFKIISQSQTWGACVLWCVLVCAPEACYDLSQTSLETVLSYGKDTEF